MLLLCKKKNKKKNTRCAYKDEEQYRPTSSNRLFEYDSDESLNLYENDAYAVQPFRPSSSFGIYGSNDALRLPHLSANYRRHSSYSHEDILNMKNQHVPIDPRYRDSRPFVKSNSNIYDNARRDFMSRRRSSSSLQDDVLRPFQLLQMNEFLRRSSPTMNRTRSTSPNVSDKISDKSNSNWNLNPSIFIEEYNDNPEVKSNNSSTNLSYSEYHQPLNEESVAPFAGRDRIPFIDDEHVFISAQHHPHICDNDPDVNCVDMPKPLPSQFQSQSQIIKHRKTVSFDLMDETDDEILFNIDNIDKIEIINPITATTVDPDNETMEPIFKFCTYKLSNSNTKSNNGTESFTNIPTLDNDNYSAYFYDEDSNNGQILGDDNTTTLTTTAAGEMHPFSQRNCICCDCLRCDCAVFG